MRSPENVLESLKSKACNQSYKYERLYRNLYNPQFYLLAYQRIQAKPGNMTAGTDGKTIDGMGMARINALIKKMRDFSYQPTPARRTYIPKSNGKMRPLGIPSFDDKLIQEVVRLILESIYETAASRSKSSPCAVQPARFVSILTSFEIICTPFSSKVSRKSMIFFCKTVSASDTV